MDNKQMVGTGGYRFVDGSVYVGSWNKNGYFHGKGSLMMNNGTRYDGSFENGLCDGIGMLSYPDGAKYEGEFKNGWFHGYGIFWRADGMKFEGEFRGGKIWGLGLTTFKDGSHGFPRCEGFFQDCNLIKKKRCPEVIQKVEKIAYVARNKLML